MKFSRIPLPASTSSYGPVFSHKAMSLHYDILYRNYTDNLNALMQELGNQGCSSINELLSRVGQKMGSNLAMGALRDQGGGFLNHTMFFESLNPNAGRSPVPSTLARVMVAKGWTKTYLERQLVELGKAKFGSGWVWVNLMGSQEGYDIGVYPTTNQDNPVMWGHIPLLGIDLWEHSYLFDYGADRATYLERVLQIIDWNVVEARLVRAINAPNLC